MKYLPSILLIVILACDKPKTSVEKIESITEVNTEKLDVNKVDKEDKEDIEPNMSQRKLVADLIKVIGPELKTDEEILVDYLGFMLLELKNDNLSAEEYFKKHPQIHREINHLLIFLGYDSVTHAQAEVSKLIKKHFSEEDAKLLEKKLAPSFEIAKLNEVPSYLLIDKSKKNVKKLLSAVAEYTVFNDYKLPETLEDLRQTIGKNFDKYTICPITKKKYTFIRPSERITDIPETKHENEVIIETRFLNGKIIGYLNYEVKVYLRGKLYSSSAFDLEFNE